MLHKILAELRHHAPFTALGALAGIILAILLPSISWKTAHRIFYVFHPLHVLLSAFVTTAMYRLHRPARKNVLAAAVIGYVGSVGLGTISDSLIPYLGELLFGLPHAHAHIGFVEEWWLVNPAALLGLGLALLWPRTKLPHAGHVLASTAASLFHILMAMSGRVTPLTYLGLFVFLFLAVWLPCCASDIVFPLLFVPAPRRRPATT